VKYLKTVGEGGGGDSEKQSGDGKKRNGGPEMWGFHDVLSA